MSVFFEFEEVDAFTTGAIGRPGDRVFYLQARHDGRHVEVKCEKQQVAAIAQYLQQVLSDLPPPEDRPLPDSLELAPPVDGAFVLGPIGLGYDQANDRLVVQLEEMGEVSSEGEVEAAEGHIRLYVTRGQAASFCEHAERVVAAGRPDCRWCSLPIDPDGHACPRMN